VTANADRRQHPSNIQIYGLSCITGITGTEAKPVENFGAPKAIISMHTSSKNMIQTPAESLGKD